MTRRVVEKLCTKKVCVDFLAPIITVVEPCRRGCEPSGLVCSVGEASAMGQAGQIDSRRDALCACLILPQML